MLDGFDLTYFGLICHFRMELLEWDFSDGISIANYRLVRINEETIFSTIYVHFADKEFVNHKILQKINGQLFHQKMASTAKNTLTIIKPMSHFHFICTI